MHYIFYNYLPNLRIRNDDVYPLIIITFYALHVIHNMPVFDVLNSFILKLTPYLCIVCWALI